MQVICATGALLLSIIIHVFFFYVQGILFMTPYKRLLSPVLDVIFSPDLCLWKASSSNSWLKDHIAFLYLEKIKCSMRKRGVLSFHVLTLYTGKKKKFS